MFQDRTRRAGATLRTRAATLMLATAFLAAPAAVPGQAPITPAPVATYADLADLAEAASLTALVRVRDQVVVEPARAPGLAPGHARLFIEAQTEALVAGRAAIGESLAYLVDVPLDAKGKPPKLKKQRFLVFADPVPGRPGQLQLVDPAAQLPATPALEQRARSVIAAFADPAAPPPISGVREVMSVAGNLAGESETQLFLDTDNGQPVSLSVVRRPGMEPVWGVSWSEIVDQAARPPAPDSVEWYRLACSLPEQLPADAFLQEDRTGRARAEADYQYIRTRLGACERLRA